MKQLLTKIIGLAVLLSFVACTEENNNIETTGNYVLGVGITSNGTTTNYAIQAEDLMSGVISAVGNGVTLAGYRDYSQGNKTVFAIGGFAEANVNALQLNDLGNLELSGTASFDRAADDIIQISSSKMLAMEYPGSAEGDLARFYIVDINNRSIDKDFSLPMNMLIKNGDHPVYSGMVLRDGKLFVSHLHFDAMYNTNHVDSNYVAIYSYPDLKFEKLITDGRTGPTGAWQTKNGLFVDEKNDIYCMSSSNISNGYSKSVKPGGFLRIKSGSTVFDSQYFFNTDLLGGKISHIKYIGNGKVFAAISTIANQTSEDRWGDKNLKLSIIDVYNKTINDISPSDSDNPLDLIHNGVGGRSFPVLFDNGSIYYPISNQDGTYIYKIDVTTYKAYKGAEIQATFVGGIFKM